MAGYLSIGRVERYLRDAVEAWPALAPAARRFRDAVRSYRKPAGVSRMERYLRDAFLSQRRAASIARLETHLRESLNSTLGADGIGALVARARAFAGDHPLSANAPIRSVKAFVEACDSPDLRPCTRPLRAYVDESVRCGLVNAFAAALSKRDQKRQRLIAMWFAQDPHWPPVILETARYKIREGSLEEAITLAKRALAFASADPEAQSVLYEAYRRKWQAGEPVGADISMADLSDRFCSAPFEMVSTVTRASVARADGPPGVFACRCGGWLPFEISDGDPDATAEDVWNGKPIQELRRSILDGDFTYCSRTLCGMITGDLLPRKQEVTEPVWRDVIDNKKLVLETGPRIVQLSHDPSCNLACPSCRIELIAIKQRERDRLDTFVERVVKPLLRRTKGSLFITGYGDPFGSKHYREFIGWLSQEAEAYRSLDIEFLTNAQLLTERQWNELGPLQKMVKKISVSIDAASAATYEDVRRPGKWEILISNLDFISKLRRDGAFDFFQINFVVQKTNFREMPEFVKLGHDLQVDSVCFQKLWNLGAYTEKQLLGADIGDPEHPDHGELIDVLRDPIFTGPQVTFSSFVGLESHLRRQAFPDG